MSLTDVRDVPPITRVVAVESGMIAWSSWSPVADEPDPTELSRPMTWNGTSPIVTVWPTGSRALNSSDAVSDPSTTTAALVDTSLAVMNLPSVTLRARTLSQAGVAPTTLVVQFVDPAVSSSVVEVVGATAATSGALTLEASALASAVVNVDAEPNPPRTPALLVALPGDTTSRLLPSALIWSLTCFCAPSPSPTVRMTAAIPIRMPSIVSNDRNRCERTAARLVRAVSSQ